jgi:glycosyltransferase involved in cell wall biosynthesis
VARNIESFYPSTSSIEPEGELIVEKDMMGPSPPMEDRKKEISVVVPVYNEIDNVTDVVEDLVSTLASQGIPFEIILVDDGSTDGTLDLAQSLQKTHTSVHVIPHGSNRGKTAALETGFRYASGKYIILMDGDGQFVARDIMTMIEELEKGFDIVNGWGKKEENESLTKIIPSLIYNSISRKLFSLDVHQFNLGFKAFKHEAIENISLKKDEHRYILPILKDKGYTISEVPVTYLPRKNGDSKYGIWRIPCGILDMVALKIELEMGERPFRLFGMLSVGLIFLGALCGLTALHQAAGGQSVNMLLLVFLILFCLCGVTMLFVGYAVEAVTCPRQ